MIFRWIHAERAEFPIATMCRVLKVSRSGYYAWRERGPSKRAVRDVELTAQVVDIHKGSRGTYGSPRIHAELLENGEKVSRKRVARLMKQEGVSGYPTKKFVTTTDSEHDRPVAANLLDRKFDVEEPNRVWAGDITYVRTWEGWLYLAVVVDLCSRKVVGWAAADHMRTDLVLCALRNALGLRRPEPGLMHHSDRGSQYAAQDYREQLAEKGIVCSMSRKGNCWDNAVVESFFGTLKTESIHRQSFPCRRQARDEIADYIEFFYNPRRRHSSLGYISPNEFERRHHENKQQRLVA